MSKDFLRSENFKIRTITGVFLTIVVILSFFTLGAVMFRILFSAAGVMACLELYLAHKSQIYRGIPMPDDRIIVLEYIVIIIAMYSIGSYLERYEIILVVLGAISTDISAYFVGSAFHDTFVKKRPFPVVSPKKSWEGIAGGIIGCITILILTFFTVGIPFSAKNICFIIFCPVAAIFGDWLASFCKRFLKIKDSSDCVYTSNLALPKLLEKLMKGHGGYLDRIDSISATTGLMFIVKLVSS